MNILDLLTKIDDRIYAAMCENIADGITLEGRFADIQRVIREEVAKAGTITGQLIGSSILDKRD